MRRGWVLGPFSERTTWAYDALSRASTLTLANGAVTTYAYDAAGRLTLLRNTTSDGTTISSFEYGNDPVANRTGVVEANGDRVTWSYDNLYQLTREQRSGDNAYDITYSYDPVGNRLTKVDAAQTTTYTYDAAGRLTLLLWQTPVRSLFGRRGSKQKAATPARKATAASEANAPTVNEAGR